MPYGAGRVFNDADSHIMESTDWLAGYAEAGIKDRLVSMRLEAGGSGAEKAINRALERQKDAKATSEIATNVVAGPKGWAAYGAMNPDERRGALDDLGFAKQLVFPTFGWRKTDPVIAGLSMEPSHFIRRAVRFTPFATEDVGTIIREGGDELFLFSSDYPHPEGTKNPIERFESSMGKAEIGAEAKDRFYRRNFEDMFAGA